MTYANPEQPVLRTPSFRPTPCPRADKKVLTRFAADSVNEIAISTILGLRPTFLRVVGTHLRASKLPLPLVSALCARYELEPHTSGAARRSQSPSILPA